MYSLAFLPGINPGEAFVIITLALLFFGAKRLPEFARGLGTAIREFSKAKDEIQNEITRPASPPLPHIEPPRETQPVTAAVPQQEDTTRDGSTHHL